jgi:multicomponent Na+:H+ antiporter subunit A
MLLAIIIAFITAVFAPVIVRYTKDWSGWILAVLPGALFTYFMLHYGMVGSGDVLKESTAWLPGINVNLSFILDGLSLTFALLITGIGTLIVIYAGGYMKGHEYLGRFMMIMLMFMASMLGVVLADNLIALFIFWEMTSFTSYLLIGFNNEKEESRSSALQALLITGLGGLALLGGLVVMGLSAGSMNISEILASGDIIREHPYYLGILILVLMGAFTKSAQFPVHFWLPGAMAAPTPVSAYLHSATMVKAGVYLLARMQPAMGDTDSWFILVTGFGAVTMLVGGWLALVYTDLKRVLAYSTVMALGTITMLIGMGHDYALKAAAVFIVGHSLYKGALFMVAGSVDHEVGTRDVLHLGGLRKLMPVTAAAAAIAAISMAGIPPMLGFIGKELVYEAALSASMVPVIIIIVAVIANIAVVASSAIVAIRPFYGEEKKTPKHAHEAPASMLAGPVILASIGLIIGIFPGLADRSLFSATTTAMSGVETSYYLSLWHGINLPLILSIITLASGLLVYRYWDGLRESYAMVIFGKLMGDYPKLGYENSVQGMLKFAKFQIDVFQSGYLHRYMVTVAGFTVFLTGITFFLKADFALPAFNNDVTIYEVVIIALMVVAVMAALVAKSALKAITALGLLGFSIALVYIMFSAPDLAITQVLVETLTVILAALVLVKLPKPAIKYSIGSKIRDGIIAISGGLVVTMLMLTILSGELDLSLSEYFGQNSYVMAHGKNIVNVILVDFRAIDTLGEIIVLAVAGFGAISLVKFYINGRSDKKEVTK